MSARSEGRQIYGRSGTVNEFRKGIKSLLPTTCKKGTSERKKKRTECQKVAGNGGEEKKVRSVQTCAGGKGRRRSGGTGCDAEC